MFPVLLITTVRVVPDLQTCTGYVAYSQNDHELWQTRYCATVLLAGEYTGGPKATPPAYAVTVLRALRGPGVFCLLFYGYIGKQRQNKYSFQLEIFCALSSTSAKLQLTLNFQLT